MVHGNGLFVFLFYLLFLVLDSLGSPFSITAWLAAQKLLMGDSRSFTEIGIA